MMLQGGIFLFQREIIAFHVCDQFPLRRCAVQQKPNVNSDVPINLFRRMPRILQSNQSPMILLVAQHLTVNQIKTLFNKAVSGYIIGIQVIMEYWVSTPAIRTIPGILEHILNNGGQRIHYKRSFFRITHAVFNDRILVEQV